MLQAFRGRLEASKVELTLVGTAGAKRRPPADSLRYNRCYYEVSVTEQIKGNRIKPRIKCLGI
jgi:hypothetical protein